MRLSIWAAQTARFSMAAFPAITTFYLVATAAPAAAQCTAHEIAAMQASNGSPFEQFGVSVDMDGDTVVVGAWLNTNANGVAAGSAYVYQRDQGGTDNWGEVATLIAPGGATDDAFGWSVSISGDTIAIGAYRNDEVRWNAGKVYLFERDLGGANNWGHAASVVASDGARDDQFGFSVSVSGATLLVGAHRADVDGTEDGAAYIYDRDLGGPGNWGEVKKVDAFDGGDNDLFGHSVALFGDTAVVGAFLDDTVAGDDAGSAFVFERDFGGANNWGERATLLASDGAPGDFYGFSVAAHGDRALVGAYQSDTAGTDSGAAYVHSRNVGGPGNWGELVKLVGSDVGPEDSFGYSVALDGDHVVVGAYLDNGESFESGVTYVFGRNYEGTDAFGESHKLMASDGDIGDRFGYSVSVSGSAAASGAIFNDPGGTNSGSAYTFDLAGVPITYCTSGFSASGCQPGISTLGTPSASATSGFELIASNVEGAKVGTFFIGQNGRQANPWGDGTSFQCVVPPIFRGGMLVSAGARGACDGTFTQDWNALWCASCPKPGKNPGAGALVQAQLWYRDPFSTSNQTTSLTNAVEFSVCP